ncbi:D-alanine--D-alanine ligase [Salinisphaera sp. Q1T1-3]|uniref:D-alanine--D-alanine ligase n=1 Tax=Salinisphaera sp. Q1T1-3 TaxID=2321229 RepID=UPI000E724A44|nr:D-alanine--D-alanine ligase [Salinisphaera sp. Q1T1-3]RJS93520.1 D-alanine--D-alanine ligase [Salinisphaera sp. Q1T1-3]
MSQTIRVAVICGGASAEHEVSLASARNIVAALDRDRFAVAVIGIDKAGVWHAADPDDFLHHADDPKRIALKAEDAPLAVVPGRTAGQIVYAETGTVAMDVDVAFPIVHGPTGEDGTLQGLLAAANIACVGAGVLGSAAAMDKDVTKRLLRDAGIDIAPFALITRANAADADYDRLAGALGSPLFVKPANLGSSVGVSRATDRDSFDAALTTALRFDHKVLVEAAVAGREIECAVLGNAQARASTAGEVVVDGDGFYAYDTKYVDDTARTVIPAELDAATLETVQQIALATYRTLDCRGLARVDVFVTESGDVVVNEINTLPGFTRISMYPKLWQASGIEYSELVGRLVDLAREQHAADKALASSM